MTIDRIHDRRIGGPPASGCAVAARRLLPILVLGLAVAACGRDEPVPATETEAAAPGAAQSPTPDTSEADAPAPATGRAASMSAEELRESARQAYAENRLYAPAGDNAVEYYLALREKLPGDASVSSALTDLLPMTVIATEQSVQREDFDEALRLSTLLEKADPQHPALARLKNSIAAGQEAVAQRLEQEKISAEQQARRQEELERQRQAEQQAQQEQAARELAAQEEARQKAEQEEAEREAAARRDREAERQAAAQRAAEPVRATAADLRPLSTPAPRYPTTAYRSGTSGVVTVEFTVGTDGAVSDARVINADPPRVFDRETVSAVRKWRFQPIANPVTTRRTIDFKPGA